MWEPSRRLPSATATTGSSTGRSGSSPAETRPTISSCSRSRTASRPSSSWTRTLPGSRLRALPASCTTPISTLTRSSGLENCRVPEANRITGGGGEGARKWFTVERLMIAARCCGAAERLLDLSRAWALERRAFEQPISQYQGVQFPLADSLTELLAARLITYHAAHEFDVNPDAKIVHGKAAMAKLYASEMAGRVADRAVQILGRARLHAGEPSRAPLPRAACRPYLGGHQRDSARDRGGRPLQARDRALRGLGGAVIDDVQELRDALAGGATLPASWYSDAAILRREQDAIFRRTWQYAGRLDQVAEPGDWFTTVAGTIPVVVTRDQLRNGQRVRERLPPPGTHRRDGSGAPRDAPVPLPRVDLRPRRGAANRAALGARARLRRRRLFPPAGPGGHAGDRLSSSTLTSMPLGFSRLSGPCPSTSRRAEST